MGQYFLVYFGLSTNISDWSSDGADFICVVRCVRTRFVWNFRQRCCWRCVDKH